MERPLQADHGRAGVETAFGAQTDWHPIFGQVGAAQSHRAHSGVAVGDLFLFFGWFRQTEIVGGRYRFVRQSPDLHVIFGWLQIGEIVSARRDSAPEWARNLIISQVSHPGMERSPTMSRPLWFVQVIKKTWGNADSRGNL